MRTHATPFRPGDIVQPRIVYGTKPTLRGKFIAYCRGYRSHCIVHWDGNASPSRVNAERIALVERKIDV